MDNASDIKIYQDLVRLLKVPEMEQLRRGAHFVLDDHGFYALLWRGLPGAQVRPNSHPYHGDAFSIQGQIFPEFLCATLQLPGRNYTWFQVERAGVRNVRQFMSHAVHTMWYMVSNRNVGPDGTSHHIDTNPIRISADRITAHRNEVMASLKHRNSV
jgi:hypothetical protein